MPLAGGGFIRIMGLPWGRVSVDPPGDASRGRPAGTPGAGSAVRATLRDVKPAPLNRDFERRPFWQATMPELPDRSGRPLPDVVDVAVVGGGYTGVATARELARNGATVTLLEANGLGSGASTRNGGIVHVGYKWGPASLEARHGLELGGQLLRDSVEAIDLNERIVTEEAIDCDWRRTGHVELAYSQKDMPYLRLDRDIAWRMRVPATVVERDVLDTEAGTGVYHGGLVYEQSGLIHPGRWFAGLAASAERAGADLHEGVRVTGVRPEADGRFVVETARGAILAGQVVAATNGHTDAALPALRRRVVPVGSYMIATEPLPADLVAELSPNDRGFFDTKNFLFYWQVSADRRLLFGGRASFLPTSVDRTAAILHRGLLKVFPQVRGHRVEYAWGGTLGFTMDRMPHVGRQGGIAYVLGYCGSGVALSTYLGTRLAGWLGGGEPPALAKLRLKLVPAPFEGRPWFLPIVGEWYRFADWRNRPRSRL
jgi:glycine/D-amino acid oxidase-like deaminating enzyme